MVLIVKSIFIAAAIILINSGCSSYNSTAEENAFFQQTIACSAHIDKYEKALSALNKAVIDSNNSANNPEAMHAVIVELITAQYNLHVVRYQLADIPPESISKWETAQNAVDSDYIKAESINYDSNSYLVFKTIMRKIDADEDKANPITDALNAESGGMSVIDFDNMLEAQNEACLAKLSQEQQHF